jgi:hypothetical protein
MYILPYKSNPRGLIWSLGAAFNLTLRMGVIHRQASVDFVIRRRKGVLTEKTQVAYTVGDVDECGQKWGKVSITVDN